LKGLSAESGSVGVGWSTVLGDVKSFSFFFVGNSDSEHQLANDAKDQREDKGKDVDSSNSSQLGHEAKGS
jgi:hypothetical protein